MPIIARSYDDLALDALVTRLTAFRNREIAISAAVNFNIERDRRSAWSDLAAPLVVLEEDSDAFEPAGSSARGPSSFRARMRAICLVPKLGDPDVTYSRLYYLKEQVRTGIWALPTIDLGYSAGILNLGRPSWTMTQFDDSDMEASILAGVWAFDLVYPWTPEDATGTPLDSLDLTVGEWELLYTFA